MSAISLIVLWLVLLHAGVAAVFWLAGAWTGLGVMAMVHAGLLGVTLWPGSHPFCPARERFPWTGKHLVLTIDDGPCDDTPAILDLLDQYHAKAVFFVIGKRAAAHPEWVQAMVARGHRVENHTWSHPAKSFWAFGPRRQREEISKTSRLITDLTDVPPAWFRAPAGFRNPFTGAVMRELGLHYLGWSSRGFDTSEPDPNRVLRRLQRGFSSGAVLLVHQGQPRSPELLERLLQLLEAEGWATGIPATEGTAA